MSSADKNCLMYTVSVSVNGEAPIQIDVDHRRVAPAVVVDSSNDDVQADYRDFR